MYKEYEKHQLKKLQSVQLKILKDFIKICDDNNLNYFLVFGTALGAVRHKGFIPWDDDVDVGMLRDDFDKFIRIFSDCSNELKGRLEDDIFLRYEVLTPFTNEEYACSVTHFQLKNTKFVPETSKDLKCNMGINIDIFAFDNVADNNFKRKIQCFRAWFLGRLLFLRGTAYPMIPLKGLSKITSKYICICVHYGLKLFCISTQSIYKRLLKVSKKYNDIECEYVTCFEDFAPLNDMIKKNEIFPLKKIEFEDTLVNIPYNNHKLLQGMYGDYMKVPEEKDRVNHCPFILDFGEYNEK